VTGLTRGWRPRGDARAMVDAPGRSAGDPEMMCRIRAARETRRTTMNFGISGTSDEVRSAWTSGSGASLRSRLEREVARARVMEDVKRQTEIQMSSTSASSIPARSCAIQAELGAADPGETEPR